MKAGVGGALPSQPSSGLVVQLNSQIPSFSSGRGGLRTAGRHQLPLSPTAHRYIPARNISALARPLPKISPCSKKFLEDHPRINEEEKVFDDFGEKKAKFFGKQVLPSNEILQYVLQDHNYCAMPPSAATQVPSPTKPPNNGVIPSNGLSRPPALPPPPRGLPAPCDIPPPSVVRPAPQPVGEESDLSSDGEHPADDGEETETAPEDEDSVTRCICDFQHDDGYMICCDKCLVWQHVDCMGIERGNIPEEYKCEECEPRKVDKARAIRIQIAKRNQFNDSSDSLESLSTPTPLVSPPQQQGKGRIVGNNKKKPPSIANRKRDKSKTGRLKSDSKLKAKQKGKSKPKKQPIARKAVVNKKAEAVNSHLSKQVEKSEPALLEPPSNNLNQLRQWIDSYEEAVTNHYSQELRARIASIKVNNNNNGVTHHNPCDFKLPTNLSTPKCKVSLLSSGIKILVSTCQLPANQAVIEVRGKYMLSKVGKSGPYVFHHCLTSADGTEVCVDTTTYGNDARFVRRSCQPNAEIKHCIEKGALHLYIVSMCQIESKAEITIPVKDGHPCCCNSGDKCLLSGTNQQSSSNANNAEKRRRGRRRTVSESSTGEKGGGGIPQTIPLPAPPQPPPAAPLPTPPPISPSVDLPSPKPSATKKKEKESAQSSPLSQVSPLPPPPPPPTTPKETRCKTPPLAIPSGPVKEKEGTVAPRNPVLLRRATTPSTKQEDKKRDLPLTNSPPPSKKPEGKMTREERKMEAIMKAFERMEKDEARKHGTGTVGKTRKLSTSSSPTREKHDRLSKRKTRSKETPSKLNSGVVNPKKGLTRRRLRRNSRRDERSVESGGEEGGPQSPLSSPSPIPPTSRSEEEGSPLSPPVVSNTCLLVAAAVGPLAPGFKFPKTKKNLLTSWFGNEISPGLNCDSPPRCGNPPDCAKKRWLRQAISEDCDSPRNDSAAVSPTEHVAPLKKRRVARESVSSEQSFTPPATPIDSNTQFEDDDDSSPTASTIDKVVNGPRTPPEEKPPLLSVVKVEEPSDTCELNYDVPLIEQIKQEIAVKEEPVGQEEATPFTPAPIKEIKEEPPNEQPTKVKRKLSISEYRERVKSIPLKKDSDTAPSTPNTNGPLGTPNSSTEDEDDAPSSPEFLTKTITFPPSLASLASDIKKGGNGSKGFSPAPTLVEQQREALTDRLRREFGLFLSDDEEEKRRPSTNATIPELVPVAPPPPPVVTLMSDSIHLRKRRREPPPPPPPPLPPSHWVFYPPTHYHMQPHH